MIELPPDFSEFLRLLKAHQVEYLVIGGYAVGMHGYPRTTGDLDIWVSSSRVNAARLVEALREFGLPDRDLSVELFTTRAQVVRIGVPPVRLELHTSITGVEFDNCYPARLMVDLHGLDVPFISLDDLLTNKRRAGRYKDLDDLEHLT